MKILTAMAGVATLLACTVAVPVMADPPLPDPYFGLHIHRADAGTAWPKAPFGAWRLWDAYTAWPNLQPGPNKWEFGRLDRYVALAERQKVDVLLPLGLTPQWASARPFEKSSYSPGNAAEPANLADWREYVRTVAQRYKGRVRHFEIWNEPNIPAFYSGSQAKLVELTCEAQRVLKSVSPENRLVSPSFVGEGREPEQFGEFLAAGGKNCIDIVGYHFYVPKGAPEALTKLVSRVRAVANEAGLAALPLWNTESGWWIENGDGTPEPGADARWLRVGVAQSDAWVARALIVGRASGLERFYWYAWDNGSMGLIEPSNGRHKPGANAYATVADWLAGASVTCTTSGSVWTCAVRGATTKEHLIAWDVSGGQGVFAVPEGKWLEAVDRLEGSTEATGSLGEARSVSLSASPTRITLSSVMPPKRLRVR